MSDLNHQCCDRPWIVLGEFCINCGTLTYDEPTDPTEEK